MMNLKAFTIRVSSFPRLLLRILDKWGSGGVSFSGQNLTLIRMMTHILTTMCFHQEIYKLLESNSGPPSHPAFPRSHSSISKILPSLSYHLPWRRPQSEPHSTTLRSLPSWGLSHSTSLQSQVRNSKPQFTEIFAYHYATSSCPHS